MNPQDYFQSHHPYFWQWEDNTEALAIPGGNTIAYRNFVKETLTSLSPQGLPPLGSLLLAIIATNPGAKEAIQQVERILKPYQHTQYDLISNTLSFLTRLSLVPQNYRIGNHRLLLLQTIFQNGHNCLSIKDSQYISREDFQGQDFIKKITRTQDTVENLLMKDLRTFALLNSKFRSVDEIVSKMAGLPQLPTEELPIEEETGLPKPHQDFIEELIENPSTFQVGALIRQLWSGLQIPVHSSLPSQQPLGGISDVTNKGDFDKLLVSEFANDDLVFLSRLANNEALYLHREIPPSHPEQKRIFLIDTSIKNWGTPKQVAFATALAIARHPKTTLSGEAYAVGNAYVPVGLESLPQVMEGLLQLNGSLHAATGLEAFLAQHPAQSSDEIFWIGSAEARNHPAMAKALHENRHRLAYCIFTDASGLIDVYKNQRTGRKHLQTLRLPLEELWKKPKKEIVPVTTPKPAGFPILFRTPSAFKKLLCTHTGDLLATTSEKALLKRYHTDIRTKGWELLHESLPFGFSNSEIGVARNGAYVLLLFSANPKEGVLFDLSTQKHVAFQLPNWKATSFASFVFSEATALFYHKNMHGCWSIDLEGKVTKVEVPTKDLWKTHAEQQEEAKKQLYDSNNVLKNIPHLYINEVHHLVFNKHELHLQQGQHIKLDYTNFQKRTIEAVRTSPGLFTFSDGSQVEILQAGMALLRSSNANIPVMYIPTVLDASLGVATPHEFAGNDYYYKDALCEVKLIAAGNNKLKVIKTVKDHTQKGLNQCKEIADTAPSIISSNMPETKAYQLKKDLELDGATVEVSTRTQANGLKKISPSTFYRQYIEAFVKHIQTHGTHA